MFSAEDTQAGTSSFDKVTQPVVVITASTAAGVLFLIVVTVISVGVLCLILKKKHSPRGQGFTHLSTSNEHDAVAV